MAPFCEAYFEINEAIFRKKFHKLYITEPQIAYIRQFHALKMGSMVKPTPPPRRKSLPAKILPQVSFSFNTVLVASTYVMAMNDVTTTSNYDVTTTSNCDVNITSNFQRNFNVSMT